MEQNIFLEMFSTFERQKQRVKEFEAMGYYVRHWDLSEVGGTEHAIAARPRKFIKKSWPKFDSRDFKLID